MINSETTEVMCVIDGLIESSSLRKRLRKQLYEYLRENIHILEDNYETRLIKHKLGRFTNELSDKRIIDTTTKIYREIHRRLYT